MHLNKRCQWFCTNRCHAFITNIYSSVHQEAHLVILSSVALSMWVVFLFLPEISFQSKVWGERESESLILASEEGLIQ